MEQAEKKPTTLTGVDLSQTASLLLPWTHDPWGKLRRRCPRKRCA